LHGQIRTIIYTLSYQQSNNQSVIQSINQHFIFLLWLMSLTYDYKPNTTDIGSHTNQLHVKRKGSLTDMGSHTWQLHVPQKKTIPDWHGITYLTTTCTSRETIPDWHGITYLTTTSTSKENDSWLTWDHIPDNYMYLKRKGFLTDMGSHTWQLHVPQKKNIPDNYSWSISYWICNSIHYFCHQCLLFSLS
jgi:hypothetical protein